MAIDGTPGLPSASGQPASPQAAAPLSTPRLPGWDLFVIALLTFALLQMSGLAEAAALPTRVTDVLRHPWLGGLLSEQVRSAFGDIGPRPGDPIGLLLNALALGLVLLYALTDLAAHGKARRRLKWLLLVGIIAATVYAPTVKLMLLRDQSGPASYSHDGGVIQTEATIQFLWEGRNPYTEDYTQTPMAEWGFSAYRTALYHFPYLPWTFLFSAPFAALGQSFFGFDQRMVYLLLLAIALALAPRLVRGERRQLALVALLALNPIMAVDIIFGQNDVFVLCWILFAFVAWETGERLRMRAACSGGAGEGATTSSAQANDARRAVWWNLAAAVLFGLACASKPTAWFLAPFLALLVAPPSGTLLRRLWAGALRLWPAALTFALILLPYIIWDAPALYDDVWRWSSGQGPTGYQIWGWGASNFVLGLGLVESRFATWPFLWLQLALAGPVLVWFLWRQMRGNTLAAVCWHYSLFLLTFFYASRFLNENYLGFLLAFLALGALLALPQAPETE
jgi:hypothetical protein